MFYNIKKVVLFLKLVTSLILVRNYGNIICDLVNKYNGLLSVSTLRKLEKLSLKCDKASLDINFLLACKRFSVVPKFINFNLPYTNHNDERTIRRRLLQSAINKRRYEKQKMEKELERLKTDVRTLVTGMDWYIIYRSIDNNVCKKRKKNLNEINSKKSFVNDDDQQSIRKCLRRI